MGGLETPSILRRIRRIIEEHDVPLQGNNCDSNQAVLRSIMLWHKNMPYTGKGQSAQLQSKCMCSCIVKPSRSNIKHYTAVHVGLA